MKSPFRGLLILMILATNLTALLAPTASFASSGGVTDIGSNVADSTTASSLVVTTTSTVSAGSTIIVLATTLAPGAVPSSVACSDQAGNSYSVDESVSDAAAITSICSSPNLAADLPGGSTITVTWTGSAGPFAQRAEALAATGLAVIPLDKVAGAVGASTTPSSGSTATITAPPELVIGAIVDESASASNALFTVGSNGSSVNCAATGTTMWSSLPPVSTSDSNAPGLFAMTCGVSGSGQFAAQGTFGSGGTPSWEAVVASYIVIVPTTTPTATGTSTPTETVTVTLSPTTPTPTLTSLATTTPTPTPTSLASTTPTPTFSDSVFLPLLWANGPTGTPPPLPFARNASGGW